MFLITSAAYISSDLITEYGKIPPVFLPLQNKRLYEHQLALIGKTESVVLSLPADFEIPKHDKNILDKHQVEIVFVPTNLSLGQSIVYVLNVIGRYNESLKILHGDTLFGNLSQMPDTYFYAKPSDNYSWAISDIVNEEEFVYSGYFSFSNQSALIKTITESGHDFISGILKYKQNNTVVEDLVDNWLDFGHSNTYYRSKTNLTTQRFFNDLIIDGFSVLKSSTDKNKMLAEANWFLNMPVALKRYLPALYNSGVKQDKGFYEIEYFYLSSLAELFVYGKNEYFIWQNILKACNKFIVSCSKYKALPGMNIVDTANRLYNEKTVQRLQIYSKEHQIELDHPWILNGIKTPSLNAIIAEMNRYISAPQAECQTIIHGDFGFSNILYDFRTNSIKVIDPRGLDIEGVQTIYGDIRYDIAKLAHSVIGFYDFIIAGHYSFKAVSEYEINFEIETTPTIKKIKAHFIEQRIGGLDINEACTYPILVHLFLSMLPLHNDDPLRQKAMLANALRLYIEFINLK